MKTYSPKPEHIERRWYVLNADDVVLGRLATEAAHILRGKHKPIYAPHMDVGDHVIVVNAAKVVLTGGKETKKVAWRHSGHPGGITGTLYEDLLATKPAFAVEKAVRGMLPKNRLGRAMIKKLHVVPGPEHRHQAQKPVDWAIGTRPAWEGLPAPAPVSATKPKAAVADTAPAAEAPVAEEQPAKKPAAKKTTARKTTAARKTAATKSTTRAKTTSTKKKTTATKKSTATKKTAARKTTSSKKTTTGSGKTSSKKER